jgi:hypothetical protein
MIEPPRISRINGFPFLAAHNRHLDRIFCFGRRRDSRCRNAHKHVKIRLIGRELLSNREGACEIICSPLFNWENFAEARAEPAITEIDLATVSAWGCECDAHSPPYSFGV